jgi:hypothetical protein
MTFLELTNTIESYIQTNWLHTPIAYENHSFTEPSSPWIHVSILHNPSENAGLGPDCVRLHGAISITIYNRYDLGIGTAIDLADKVATILQNKTIGEILTYTTDVLKVGDARRQMNRIESGYYMVLTQTRFETSS